MDILAAGEGSRDFGLDVALDVGLDGSPAVVGNQVAEEDNLAVEEDNLAVEEDNLVVEVGSLVDHRLAVEEDSLVADHRLAVEGILVEHNHRLVAVGNLVERIPEHTVVEDSLVGHILEGIGRMQLADRILGTAVYKQLGIGIVDSSGEC